MYNIEESHSGNIIHMPYQCWTLWYTVLQIRLNSWDLNMIGLFITNYKYIYGAHVFPCKFLFIYLFSFTMTGTKV